MKVVAFNGSPRKNGNTGMAIEKIASELEKEGIEVEIIHVGNKNIRGCLACGGCSKNQNEKCVIDDMVNVWINKMKEADGIILGSPTYYSAIAGTMKCFLDRAFYVTSVNQGLFKNKVGVSVVADRRSGGIPVFNQLNNYTLYSGMVMPSSNYWNVVYGTEPREIEKDEEGMQILSILGENMAWLLKVIKYSEDKIEKPKYRDKVFTNFIR